MSLLWKNMLQLLTTFLRPSPKHIIHSRFAQSINFTQYIQFPLTTIKQFAIEGISLFTSREKTFKAKGSMTVEAAVVLPLFLFFFLNLGSAMEMIRLHSNLQLALWQVGDRLAVYGHVLQEVEEMDGVASADDMASEGTQTERLERVWADVVGVVLSYIYIKDRVEDYLGKDYLDTSPLKDGADSLHFLESDISAAEDYFEIVMTYQVAPLAGISAFLPFRMANKYYGHFWNGYNVGVVESSEEYVYIAENGKVYHKDRECTYLILSIKQVSLEDTLKTGNEQGKKYRACEVCCKGLVFGNVYITEQGDCYHYMKSCLGLKRTVYKIPVSQVGERKGCSRCVGGG